MNVGILGSGIVGCTLGRGFAACGHHVVLGTRDPDRHDLPGGPPTMFIAGDDEAAKGTAREMLDTFGWETIDLGGIAASRWLEAMAMAWIAHGFRTGTWGHAFKLLSAPA